MPPHCSLAHSFSLLWEITFKFNHCDIIDYPGFINFLNKENKIELLNKSNNEDLFMHGTKPQS
jgi:hypothetical protein